MMLTIHTTTCEKGDIEDKGWKEEDARDKTEVNGATSVGVST